MSTTSQLEPEPTAPSAGAGDATVRPTAVLVVLSAAAFMASLDLFIVNVAFPAIGHDFHGASLSDLSWVLNAYAILYAALLVPAGRMADRFGRKAGFLGGLGLFTLASVACALSPGLWWLVGFRGLQALGAALLTPTSLGLLLNAMPAERRVRAVRTWAATGALAAAAGPIIGGLLVNASWRWVFLVNAPVGVVALVAAARLVPDSRDPSVTRRPDLIGAGVLTVAIAALALGVVKGSSWGWGSVSTLASFGIAVAGVALFWYRSEHHPMPIVEPALLRVRAFAWSNLTAVLFTMAFSAGLLSCVLWMQDVWHWSALDTGLGVAPGPVMVPIFAALAQRVAHRVPVGWIASAGCVLFGVGYLVILLSAGPAPSYASEILPGWIIGGIGVGLALPTILSAATADLPPARSATGSAVVNMSRQIGSVLGVSVLVALIGTSTGYANVHAGFVHGWWVLFGVAMAGAAAALGMTPRRA